MLPRGVDGTGVGSEQAHVVARPAELTALQVVRRGRVRPGVSARNDRRPIGEGSRSHVVPAVADPRRPSAILGPGKEALAGDRRDPVRIAFVVSPRGVSGACGAVDLMAEGTTDSLEGLARQKVHDRTPGVAADRTTVPGGHRRLQVLSRGVAVDTPKRPAGSRLSHPRDRVHTGSGSSPPQHPCPTGTVVVLAHLLLDQHFQGAEQRAFHRVGHHRSVPLRGMLGMASRAVVRQRLALNQRWRRTDTRPNRRP